MPATDGWITVVSGLPRSGTSMMMRMLEAGGIPALTDSVRTADADNPNGYYEFEAVKQLERDTSWVAGARGRAVKMVYSLVPRLPAAESLRVILMIRNLDEVLASQDTMLQRHGKAGGAVDDARMKQLFERQLREFDTWVANQGHVQMLKVDYNQMIGDTAACVRNVSEFLGGGLDVEAMARIYDPTLYRQRR